MKKTKRVKNQVSQDNVIPHKEVTAGLIVQSTFLDSLSVFLEQVHQYPFIQIVGDGGYVHLHNNKHSGDACMYVLPANYYFTLNAQPFTLFYKLKGEFHELFYSMTPDMQTSDLVYQPYREEDDGNRPFSDSFQKLLNQAIASSSH